MPRDYKDEYRKFQSSDKAKKDRASRNAARRSMINSGRAKKGDGKDVAHKNGNPRDNSPGNLMSQSRKKNRGRAGEGGRKKK
jgi:hypothetical protein